MADEIARLDDARTGIILASGVPGFLNNVRPEWKAKPLIQRVTRLIEVDPSSACQRLFNAAIHDLRQKLLRAGVDLASEAARRNKLPPIERPEDILENYSTARIIDLAYRVGFLSRAEWRRLERCYQIRRDLEHEDHEYEAEIEDIIYIFRTCVEIVLSREPVELIRLEDVEELIKSPERTAPSAEFLHEYELAPDPRQKQIVEHLVNTALNSKKPDIIRQNAMDVLRAFAPLTRMAVQLEISQLIQDRVGKGRLELVVAKVAHAAGVLPFLKQRQVRELFHWFHERLREVGHHWKKFEAHEKLLDDLEDIGGLVACPEAAKQPLVTWLTLCYLGEPGGYGTLGRNRAVFFSDTAAPRIERLIRAASPEIMTYLIVASQDDLVGAATRNKFVARRFEKLFEFVGTEST